MQTNFPLEAQQYNCHNLCEVWHVSRARGSVASTAAEPLRFLDFLIYEPVKAVLLHGAGTAVTVPAPERFAVHKLILSRRRKSADAKADKDLRQAAVLLQILSQKRPEDLKRAWEEALQRGPNWRELLLAGTAQLPASVQESLKASGLTER